MRWACCLLPSLALEVFPAAPAPRVVVDGPAQRPRVHAADPAALAAGVRPGQALAAAEACCNGLQRHRRDRAAELARLQLLALRAYACSAQVVLAPPAALLLEVGASLRLFGGWPPIRQRLRAAFAAEGHAVRIALAPTPAAARLFAGLGDGISIADGERLARRLDALPVADAGLDAASEALLHAVGVRRLGEARRLPAAALARRAGKALIAELDRLYGRLPDPQTCWQPPRRFALACEFEYGIDTTLALRFPLQRLSGELARHLQARDAAVQRFQLRFLHEGRPPSTLEIGLRTPLREASALFDAARHRLDRHRLPAAAHGLELLADDLPAFVPANADLFDAARRGQDDWDALVERLRARLGDDAVETLAAQPDHRPERAWRRGPAPATATATVAAGPRPLWLLPQPQPLQARIVAVLGPGERIESGWWDGADARRDYVVADLDSGQRAWLFRPAGREDAPWMVHGWFA